MEEFRLSDFYKPNAQQLKAHRTPAFETLYGGAAFGGKSWFQLFEALRHCLAGGSHAKAILFRRTYPELEDSLIEESMRVYPKDEAGMDWNSQKHIWKLPNGSSIRFRNLEHRKDVDSYKSAQFTFMAFDEVTTFQEYQYVYLTSRCRTTSPLVRPRVVAGTNPTGLGHAWVKKRFRCGSEGVKTGTPPETVFEVRGADGSLLPSRVFIPARATDNVAGMRADPDYYHRLLALPPEEQKALIYGDWDIFAGQAFSEWDPSVHICKPFRIPRDWAIMRCIDWGYSSPFYVGWIAIVPSSPERYYLVDEWYGARTSPEGAVKGLEMAGSDVGRGIAEREEKFDVPVAYGIGPPDMWAKHGEEGASPGDLISAHVHFKTGIRDRRARKLIFHEVLKVDPTTNEPRFKSFSTNRGFNTTFPELVLDETDPELVHKGGQDHPYDAGGYGLLSRGLAATGRPRPRKREMAAVTRTHQVSSLI